MNIQQLAAKIPAEYRKEILELNLIDGAKPNASDKSMNYLVQIWKAYVDPYFDTGCPMCYSKLLKNFQTIKGELVKAEKNDKMLDII